MGIREDFDHQIEMDLQTLRHLAERGNDDLIERPIDHSFYHQEKKPLEELAGFLEKIGFQDTQVKQGEDKKGNVYHYLETKTTERTDSHTVSKTSLLMCCLSAIFQVGYDGWGTHVENKRVGNIE